MSQIIPIKIPTYISSETFAPARVLPRLFYYNGLVDCERYYIASGSLTVGGVTYAQNAFPYFDNYNVVTGSFPTVNSKSLLFTNEAAAYGEIPTDSLYSEYWETYISLLYNPRTRLVTCEAIIPLADYFKMELNDIVQWRGNYYHLRAINDYNLSNGECNLQLLGPIIEDSVQFEVPGCNFAFTLQQTSATTTTTAGPTTTTTAGPTTTTTTTTAGTTTTTTAGTTTTTTTAAPTTTTTTAASTIFRAANCQDIYDFNTYRAFPTGALQVGDVLQDAYGTCYSILNFSGSVPVGTLTYIGHSGSCGQPPCLTTTTTAAPFCNIWQVSNATGAGYYLKYKPCGASTFTYPQVTANTSMSLCVQNNEIYNAFAAPMTFTNLSQSCETTTTTTLAPGCSTFVITNNGDLFSFSGDYVYCGNNFSSSYSVGTHETVTLCVQDGKIDLPSGINYVINISGSCNSTTTTTTTIAPGCYLATIINNTAGFTFTGDYVYCGASVSQSFSVASGTSASFCTQTQKIDLPSGPNYTSSFSAVGGCAATTTTTTTLAPGCYLATIVNNNTGTTWVGEYVYCGNNFSQSFSVASGTSASFCTQDKKIDLPPSASYYTSSFSVVGGCAATTTTTTTIAPGCYSYTIINNNTGTTFIGDYVYCGTSVSQSYSISSGTSASLCVQDQKIDLPSGPNYTSSFTGPGTCVATTTTTTAGPTTTTTTLPVGCFIYDVTNNGAGSAYFDYQYCNSGYVHQLLGGSGASMSVCVLNGNISSSYAPMVIAFTGTPCVTSTTTTTTTTIAPTTTTTTLPAGCYIYDVVNNGAGSAYFDYKYCGSSYVHQQLAGSGASMSVCVDNHLISSSYAPMVITYTGVSCVTSTTTTTSTTTSTTTTLAPTTTTTTLPFCNVWTASNAFGAGYEIKVMYCGDVSYSFPTVPPNSSIYVCVQNDDITNNGNPITLYSSSVACSGSIITTTTTTTTAAPTTTTTTLATTTTTTTAAPTTTTTTTLASQKYYVESCEGPGDIVGVITITNAPLLTAGQVIRLNTNVAGLSCFVVYSTSTGTSVLGTRSVTNIYTDCVDCTD